MKKCFIIHLYDAGCQHHIFHCIQGVPAWCRDYLLISFDYSGFDCVSCVYKIWCHGYFLYFVIIKSLNQWQYSACLFQSVMCNWCTAIILNMPICWRLVTLFVYWSSTLLLCQLSNQFLWILYSPKYWNSYNMYFETSLELLTCQIYTLY